MSRLQEDDSIYLLDLTQPSAEIICCRHILSDTPKIYAYGRYMDSDGITNIQICILCQRKYNILKTERKEGNSIIRELGEDIDYMRKEMKENAISYQKKIDFLQDKINILTNSVEKMDLFCEMNKNN